MTGLDEIAGLKTAAVRDEIPLREQELSRTRARLDSLTVRIRQAQGEARAIQDRLVVLKRDSEGAQKAHTELNAELDALEEKRQELIGKIAQSRATFSAAQDESKEAHAALKRKQAEIEAARKQEVALKNELAEKERQRRNAEDRLSALLRSSFNDYMEGSFSDLVQSLATEDQIGRRLEAASKLEELRHVDMKIADLWEQRQEARALLGKATLPGTRDALKQALQAAEAGLTERIPGLDLSANAGSMADGTERVRDIYYWSHGQDGALIAFPVPQRIWDSIERGEVGAETTAAMRLLAAAVDGLPLSPAEGKFCCVAGWCCFAARVDEVSALSAFALRGGVGIEYALRVLPQNIQEAIDAGADN